VDDAVRQRERHVGTVEGGLSAGAWLGELTRLFPELAEAGPPRSADPGDALRLFEALAEVLRRLALARPLGVLLEDCHWADDMTLRFLAFFARRLHSAPILMVVSVREEELADNPAVYHTLNELAAEGRLTRLTLGPLGRDDTLALVRRLGHADTPAALAERGEQVWAASAGNPFIVIETMRAIRDGVTVGSSAGVPVPTASGT
jgi:predicted ATPase